MDENKQPRAAILETAWRLYGQLDEEETKRSDKHLDFHRWVATLGILATLLAILTQAVTGVPDIVKLVIKILLIITPILASGVAAFANYFYANGDWLVMRAGAEEIKKEIFFYRTVLKNTPKRREYLEDRLTEIQRNVFRAMGGEFVVPPYTGTLPPRYNPNDPSKDNGFDELDGEQYRKFRLENQLNWHSKKIQQFNKERRRVQALILLSGGAGSLLAALPWGQFGLWVALSASFTSALLGWKELRNLDSIIKNYSKVVVELSIILDHWKNIEEKDRTEADFFSMVHQTENLLWTQNAEYIKSMQEAMMETSLEKESSLINRVVQASKEADERLKQGIEDSTVNFVTNALNTTADKATEVFDTTLQNLAEDASSEIVQQELAAMGQAVNNLAQNVVEEFSDFTGSLKKIADQYSHVQIGQDTPAHVLNEMMAHYPKSDEVKG